MAGRYVLGVDIGTTFTAAAVERDGRVTVCTLGTRTQSIPTVVAVAADGQVVVGEAADRRATIDPTQVAREFKRRLGDTTPLMLGGASYTPQALMAIVLRHVVREVTAAEDGPPAEVVLTHPASFGPYKRELMGEVLRLADVHGGRLLTEPEAAAIAYSQKATIEPGRTVAVYDLGGGTFDAALVRRSAPGGFELVGSADGIDRLGGVDFDQAFMELVLDHAGLGLDQLEAASTTELAALRARCRDAKEALSTDHQVDVQVGLGGVNAATVTRPEFEQAIGPRVMETIESMQRVIRSSGLQSSDIDRVLLVGGSSRIPLVATTVRTRLGLPVAVDANPKYLMSSGAALTPTISERAEHDAHLVGTAAGAAAATSETATIGATPPAATQTAPMPPVPTTPPPPPTSRRPLVLIAGGVALAALIGGLVALQGGDDSPRTASTTVIRTASTTPHAVAPIDTVPITTPATVPTTKPATTPITTPATTPATTPNTTPVGSVELPIDATVFLRGVQYHFTQLDVVPSEHRLQLDATATNTSRTAVEPTTDPMRLVLADGSAVDLTFEAAGALSGTGVSTRATLSTTGLPDQFSLDGTRLVLGADGQHQAVVALSSGGAEVVQSLAPTSIPASGAARTNLGVTFDVTSVELAPWACTGFSDNLAFVNSRFDENSIIIHGDLAAGQSQSGGTSLTRASGGFSRLTLPDGAVLDATVNIDDVLTQNQRVRDGAICFSGVPEPLAGTYTLSILSGAYQQDVGVGTVQFTVPDGAAASDTESARPGRTSPLDATVWVRGVAVHLQAMTLGDDGTLSITGDLTNTSRATVNAGEDPVAVRVDGSDLPMEVRVSSPLGGEANARVTLVATGLPAGFDAAGAQLVIGAANDHQAVVDLANGQVVSDQAPRNVSVDATLSTNFGITFHATGAQVVPWACSDASSRIAFSNTAADQFSLLVTGDLAVDGTVPAGGTTLTSASGGFTRVTLPDGTVLEASATIDDLLTSDSQIGDVRLCFTGLTEPLAGTYTVQIRAGSTDSADGGTGSLQITVPAS